MRFVRTADNLFGLPLGFTRVEYLESSGTQYIDTGFMPNQDTKIDLIGKFATNYPTCLYATRWTQSPKYDTYGCYAESANLYTYYGRFSDNQFIGVNISEFDYINTYINFVQDKNVATYTRLDGEDSWTYTFNTATFQSTRTLTLFYFSSTVAFNTKGGTIKSCKIYDDGILVRDFIPCIDPLGVACMYDLVGKKPYYNQGTGTFTAGRQVIPVDYLESTGTQYIDTGVGGDLTTELTCEAAIVQAGNASVTNIMGNNVTSTRAITINMSANITNPSPSRIRFGNTDNTTEAGAINLNTFYKYDTNKNELTVMDSGGTVLNTYSFNATTAFTTNGNILIYKLGDTSTQYIGKIKVKSATIKNSGVLVRDFIPCKDENNVGFMFDKVSGTCYLNAGTGAFSVGENKHTSKLRLIKEAKELPDGYKRVEYLESIGGQLIDTGYNINTATDEVICNFQLISTTLYQWLMGEHDNNARFGIGVGDGTNKRNIAYGATTYKVNDTQVYNNRHVFTANSNGVYLDGTQVHGFESFSSTSTIYLFNLNISGGGNSASGKIWSYKHKRNGILIRDFVPCIDPQGVPCMYDLVSGGTYYNQGTGSFSYGHIITPIEYLESSGTQYIDTGYIPSNTTGQYAKMQYTTVNNGVTFGGMISGNGVVGPYYATSSANVGWWIRWGTNEPRVTAPTPTTTNTYEMYLNFNNDRIARVDNIVITNSLESISGNYPSLTLFRRNYSSGYAYLSGKIFSYKITEGTKVVRSFIPVRDENNVGYMFDEVTGQLFGNAGSGSFVIGNDLQKPKVRFIQDVLPREYRPLKYLESTGTQYILTGFTPTLNTDFEIELSSTDTLTRWVIGCPTWVGVHYKTGTEVGITNSSTAAFQKYTSYNHDNSKLTMKLVGSTVYANGVSLGTITRRAGTLDFALFGYRDANQGATLFFVGNIYKCIIWDNGVPVRDFYPALRKSDNKPGMYDRITKQFFTNASISGNDFNYE